MVEVRFVTEETDAGILYPDKLYTVAEVAAILRTDRPASVHEIPETELTPTRVGAKGGKKLYRGRDILRYLDARRAIPLKEEE